MTRCIKLVLVTQDKTLVKRNIVVPAVPTPCLGRLTPLSEEEKCKKAYNKTRRLQNMTVMKCQCLSCDSYREKTARPSP